MSGRQRKPREINGKSANLNNCLKNVIFQGQEHGHPIPPTELVVVFDADMVAKEEFFLKARRVV